MCQQAARHVMPLCRGSWVGAYRALLGVRDARAQVLDLVLERELLLLEQLPLAFAFALRLRVVAQLPEIRRPLLLRGRRLLLLQAYAHPKGAESSCTTRVHCSLYSLRGDRENVEQS